MYGQLLVGFAPLALVAPLAIRSSDWNGSYVGGVWVTIVALGASAVLAFAQRQRRLQARRILAVRIERVQR